MKAVLYARVSSEKQDTDLSLSAQLRALREYAAKNAHEVIKEFVDEAESGRTTRRPAFMEMVAVAKRKERPFDLILVWKFSRFARSREDSIVFKTMLAKHGVKVVSITEPSEDTPTGKLFEAMIESLDEFYSANLGEEVTRGMRESAGRGFYLSARRPYGYRKIKISDGARERTRLEVDKTEAEVVVGIFEAAIRGKGLTQITQELNGRHLPGPKGQHWGKTGVRHILGNELYTGTIVWGRHSKRDLEPVRVENACPAIVDRTIFEQAQEAIRVRAPAVTNPRRTSSRYLLSGLARCGYCGKALVGQDGKSGRFTYYACGDNLKKGAGTCKAGYLNSNKFEAQVVDKINQYVLTEDSIRQMVQEANEAVDAASSEFQDRLDTCESALADVNRRMEALYDAVETGKLKLDEVAPRLQQHREKQKELQAAKWEAQALLSNRHFRLAEEGDLARRVADLRQLLKDGNLPERRAFIRGFVRLSL